MDENKKREQKISKIIKTSRLMLSFAWKEKEGRIYIFCMLIMAVTNAVFSAIYAIFPGLIINELITNRDIYRIILFVFVVVASPVVAHFFNKFFRLYSYKLRCVAELRLVSGFYAHTMSMDYETLEKPEIQMLKKRAFGTIDNVFGFINIISGFVSSFVVILTMSTIVTTINPLIILLVITVVTTNYFVAKKVNEKNYAISKSRDDCENRSDVVRYMMSYIGYAQENRLFGTRDFLLGKFSESTKTLNDSGLSMEKNTYKSSSCNSITNMVQQLLLYTYLIYNVLLKGLEIGTLSIYMNSVGQLSTALNSVFSSYLSIARNSLDIQDYIEFISIPSLQRKSGNRSPLVTRNSVIEFRNVSFKYPGAERFVINNLNLIIKCSEKLCIVGANGSGKTTFVKLLTRLYFPTQGEILLDGVNINEFDYEKYQALFSPVFQEYAIYSMTLEENVCLKNEKSSDILKKACENSDLSSFAKKLANGYETQIGKEIDPEGVLPSGGEGQKIAIARMLYHERPFFILDEPTATLDPISENEIYMRVHEVISDKTAILITHRLSAVQLADKVAVFDDGHVAEYGTHAELYAKGGLYTEMFDKQAKFYRDDPSKNGQDPEPVQ